MAQYRAYVLDDHDHILRRIDLEAENSAAALAIAKQYVDGHDVEVWEHTHIIGRLKHEKKRR